MRCVRASSPAILGDGLARGIKAPNLLGCDTGAAVAASFNAPIAGAIFALVVILCQVTLHSISSIVIASLAGAVMH